MWPPCGDTGASPVLLVTLFSRKVSLGRLWWARTSFVYKTLLLVRIFLLTNALNKRVLLFFLRKLFYKSNRKLFSCVCISWYKHSRGWEISQQLCKPSTSRVCMTVSNSPNPSRVYIKLCKHGKRFLLLKYHFTTVLWHFLPYHFTPVMEHFLSLYHFTRWCDIFYLKADYFCVFQLIT